MAYFVKLSFLKQNNKYKQNIILFVINLVYFSAEQNNRTLATPQPYPVNNHSLDGAQVLHESGVQQRRRVGRNVAVERGGYQRLRGWGDKMHHRDRVVLVIRGQR